MSLQCMKGLPSQFPQSKVLTCVKPVMACVARSLDDPKRHVRKEAVDCRAVWLAVDQPDEE